MPDPVPAQAELEQEVCRTAEQYDAVIVGAGPAGLNAALVLGVSRQRVLLLDGGPPRNARAQEAHGVFTRDGIRPVELKRIGLEQLVPYDVTVRSEPARQVREIGDGFGVQLGTEWVLARRLLLASGIRDLLPRVSGLKERWGRTIHHCPYCDGWPNRRAPLAVLGSHQEGHHLALSLRNWTEHLTLLTDGPDELTEEQRLDLQRLGIALDTRPILRLSGKDTVTVHFHGGETLELEGIFLNPTQDQRSHLPAQRQTAGGQRERHDQPPGRVGGRRYDRCPTVRDERGGQRHGGGGQPQLHPDSRGRARVWRRLPRVTG
ncbi:NAD(P)/FAD-dependent oxidoreductase [Deinococcus sp. Marseille-Q6407]|uniref:NAD(P)/FAD-dependent oxidoreductase n=1 Tax=Deinococcus sp. Marseille-Q6407 TaxID=2969223 RepID=UPI0028FC28BE|nr:NAD(P)/FAD-dependent oxidoreductase [Deinococcus sp. Marseille-Q6407]